MQANATATELEYISGNVSRTITPGGRKLRKVHMSEIHIYFQEEEINVVATGCTNMMLLTLRVLINCLP